MALTSVTSPDQEGGAAPKKSALETFANILNMGTSLASLGANAYNTFNTTPNFGPKGTFSLAGQASAPNLGTYDYSKELGSAPAPSAVQFDIYQSPTFQKGKAGNLTNQAVLTKPQGTNW